MTLATKTIRQIEASLARAVGENEPGIAVGIAQGGRMVWGGARGVANLKSQEVFSTKTPFRICSISKQFSCALVMREVAAGRIELSAHPSRYVTWTKVLDRELTIGHLMQNKSGIRDQWVMAMFMGAHAEQKFTLADGVVVKGARVSWHYLKRFSRFEDSGSGLITWDCQVGMRCWSSLDGMRLYSVWSMRNDPR